MPSQLRSQPPPKCPNSPQSQHPPCSLGTSSHKTRRHPSTPTFSSLLVVLLVKAAFLCSHTDEERKTRHTHLSPPGGSGVHMSVFFSAITTHANEKFGVISFFFKTKVPLRIFFRSRRPARAWGDSFHSCGDIRKQGPPPPSSSLSTPLHPCIPSYSLATCLPSNLIFTPRSRGRLFEYYSGCGCLSALRA